MKTHMRGTLRRFIAKVAVFLMAFGFATSAFAETLLGSADLTGDGVVEYIYNSGTGTISIRDSHGLRVGYYYIGPAWAANAVTDLDGVAGLELVVSTSTHIVVITQRTKTLSRYNVAPYTAGVWAIVMIDQFDTSAGNEIAIINGRAGAGSAILILSQRAKTLTPNYFVSSGSWNILSINDFDGVLGKEIAIKTPANGHVAILHPMTHTPSYYYCNSVVSLVSVSNLDGVAGLELKLKRYGGLFCTIYDRKRIVTYSGT